MTLIMINGRLTPAETATVPALDQGFTHGLGLYETLKLVGGIPVFFEEHMDRLDTGLAQLGIASPAPRTELAQQIVELSQAAAVPDGACRALVTAGPPQGRPTVLFQVEVRQFPKHPLALISFRALRSAADLKSKSFTTSFLAVQAAKAAGADDALFVDEQGRAHEASSANLFLYRQAALGTPPVDGSILPGVIRAKVMALATGAGIPVREEHIDTGGLGPTDTLLLTSSVRGIVVGASIDGRSLDTDGQILDRLRTLLFDAEAVSAAAFRRAYSA